MGLSEESKLRELNQWHDSPEKTLTRVVDGNGIIPIDPGAHTEPVALAQAGPGEGADLPDIEVVAKGIVQVLGHTALAGAISAKLPRFL